MFPFKTGGELYIFNAEKPQRLLASVVKNPHTATHTKETKTIRICCVNTFSSVFLMEKPDGFTLDGYYSTDARILYSAILKVINKARIF